MDLKRVAAALVLLTVAAGMAGCNLPIRPTPTEFVFPTPNLTMTAIFKPPVVIPPTVTPPAPTQPPATAVPTTAPSPTRPPATATSVPPTATSASPTSTSVPTNMRLQASVEAPFLNTTPTIDGDWSEWTAKAYSAPFVVFGKSNWKDAEDLEGSFRVGWDNSYLYVAIKVLDDQFVQGTTGQDIFRGDSAEILFDANVSADYFDDSLSADDFQLGISPGKGQIGQNVESYLWFPKSKSGAVSNVKIGAVQSNGIWRVEAAIPWSLFGVTPASGNHYGFAISISDNDKSGENLQQSMCSNASGRSLADPTTWGDLTLKK
jgi:hypothetical protein